MYHININVRFLESVINPEVERVKELFVRENISDISNLSMSKGYSFNIACETKEEATQRAKELAESLFVNQAMESYDLTVEEV
ncbi:MAG TPA: phosphoribosylformylglycinamidine synthase subunit PurS [Alloiococcus sp.]|nr:phosphoribosylformylglycinamidine synthase subunit PurS [Alloiococcus sp.]